MKTPKLLLALAVMLLFPILSFAQDTLGTVCDGTDCLSGSGDFFAAVLQYGAYLVVAATVALKVVKDKTTWYGKIIDRIANLKITKNPKK